MAKLLRRMLALVLLIGTLNCISFSAAAVKTTAKGRCTSDEERYIWDFFQELTGDLEGTAGIVGNLFYESHLLSHNLEKLGHELPKLDVSYTEAVDNGSYKRFTTDGTGYGLAQWTFPARKQRLLDLAQRQGRSIGSLDVQLDLVAAELEDYNMIYRLSNADTVAFASDYVLINFENPRNKSPEMMLERRKICQMFYEKYALGNPDAVISDAQALVAAVAKHSAEYKIDVIPGYCQDWAASVYEAAGHNIDPSHSAAESADRYSISDDLSEIPVGAAVYGHSNSEFGHVGIYVGGGKVYHVGDKVLVDKLEDWIETSDGFCWGWIGGADLTLLP